MKTKKAKLITAVCSAVVVLTAILLILLLTKDEKKVEIYAEDSVAEFDGNSHGIKATTSVEGNITYEYKGIDNNYKSALEPTNAGEYDVKITYKAYKGKDDTETKSVKLTIALPYNISEDGITISDYKGTQKEVVLPTTYRNKEIKYLADNTFTNSDIASIKMPETVFYLNAKALSGSNVEKIYISENTKIPDGDYTNIEFEFYGKPKTLYSDTFGAITGVDELTLPLTVTKIEENALSKIGIRQLTLSCELSLYGQTLSETLKTVKVEGGDNGRLTEHFFEGQTTIETIELTEGIYRLGDKAFYNCSGLKELILNSSPSAVGENCLNSDFTLEKLVCGCNVEIYSEMRNWLNSLNIETVELINGNVVSNSVFKDCEFIKKVILSSTIEKIDVAAFSGCTNLVEIVLPDSLTEIGSYAFRDCSRLSEINLPNGLKTIGHFAFENCDSLEHVSLPDSVEVILDGAFWECDNLKTVDLSDNLKTIATHAFYACYILENIIIPDSVTEIGTYAFSSCEALTEIEISLSSNLESIGSDAFLFCGRLKNIRLPEKIKSLGSEIFTNTDIEKIEILSESMPICEEKTFYGVSKTKCVIYVPSNLIEAYSNAFPNKTFSALE